MPQLDSGPVSDSATYNQCTYVAVNKFRSCGPCYFKDIPFDHLGATGHVENLLARVKVRWWLFIVQRRRKHGRYAEALEILHKITAAQPNRALAFLQTGFCLAKLNRLDEALRAYDRVLQITPNYGEAHAYLGLAYHDLGRNQEALEALNRAFRMKPSLGDEPHWLHMLGVDKWEFGRLATVACGFHEINRDRQ
jgi:tetratricopeptide (TPR) repeat protein